MLKNIYDIIDRNFFFVLQVKLRLRSTEKMPFLLIECFNLYTILANMVYNNTILLTVSGLLSDFYWNMSDVNHTLQEGFHKGSMIGTFLMLSFQPTHTEVVDIFTTKYFESQMSKNNFKKT